MRPLAADLLQYNLGDGLSTSFFMDPWLGHPPIQFRNGDWIRHDLGCDRLCKVGIFIDGRRWNLPTPTTLDMHELWPEILATPIGPGRDSISWIPTKDGFTFRSAWEAVRHRNPTAPWASLI